MIIVDPHWEKRNLGVDCYEILVEENDTLEDFKYNFEQISVRQYMVIKVPVARFDVMQELTNRGFVFIEGSVSLEHCLDDLKLNNLQKRINKSIAYNLMNDSDHKYVYSQIFEGIFNTDRINLDPFFTTQQAANRYVNWIGDEIKKGACLYNVVYDNQNIGFFILKEIGDGVYYPFLASLFNNHKYSSLGLFVILKILECCLNNKAKLIKTSVSTNNLPALKIHSSLGFQIENITYTYIKHND